MAAHSAHAGVQEAACGALRNLSARPGAAQRLLEAGALEAAVTALRAGAAEAGGGKGKPAGAGGAGAAAPARAEAACRVVAHLVASGGAAAGARALACGAVEAVMAAADSSLYEGRVQARLRCESCARLRWRNARAAP